MSATGILIRYNIKGPNIKPQIINSNFNKFSNYRDFNTESNFGVKDILILDDEIYVSFTEKDVNNGYNTSVVKSKISNQLDFKYVLKSQQFIKLKLGIATNMNMRPAENYVLEPFPSRLEGKVQETIDTACEALDFWLENTINETIHQIVVSSDVRSSINFIIILITILSHNPNELNPN